MIMTGKKIVNKSRMRVSMDLIIYVDVEKEM